MMTFSEVIVSSSEKKYIFYISSISIAVNNWHMCPQMKAIEEPYVFDGCGDETILFEMSPVKYFHQGHTHWHKSKTWFMYNEKRCYVDLVLNTRNNNIRRKMTQQVCKILFLQSKLSGLKAPGFIFLNWFFTRRVWQHHNWTFSEGTFPKKFRQRVLSIRHQLFLMRRSEHFPEKTFLLILQISGSR